MNLPVLASRDQGFLRQCRRHYDRRGRDCAFHNLYRRRHKSNYIDFAKIRVRILRLDYHLNLERG